MAHFPIEHPFYLVDSIIGTPYQDIVAEMKYVDLWPWKITTKVKEYKDKMEKRLIDMEIKMRRNTSWSNIRSDLLFC